MTQYRVALDVYDGPLDLLLYLIRREEVDIYDIPIAHLTKQYLQYIELLKELDPDAGSEFLVLAATLMEIKSRTLLPRPPEEEADGDDADPRLELVRQLLEYKKFKDAARHLHQCAADEALKFPRIPNVAPPETDEMDLDTIDIWDLFDTFNRLLEQTGKQQAVHTVDIDDTPIALHAEDMLDSLERAGGAQPFEDIFAGRTRAEMIGLFLALLELIRKRRIRVTQERATGPIWINLLVHAPIDDPNNPVEADAAPIEPIAASDTTAQAGATADGAHTDLPIAPVESDDLDNPGVHDGESDDSPVAPADSRVDTTDTQNQVPSDETI